MQATAALEEGLVALGVHECERRVVTQFHSRTLKGCVCDGLIADMKRLLAMHHKLAVKEERRRDLLGAFVRDASGHHGKLGTAVAIAFEDVRTGEKNISDLTSNLVTFESNVRFWREIATVWNTNWEPGIAAMTKRFRGRWPVAIVLQLDCFFLAKHCEKLALHRPVVVDEWARSSQGHHLKALRRRLASLEGGILMPSVAAVQTALGPIICPFGTLEEATLSRQLQSQLQWTSHWFDSLTNPMLSPSGSPVLRINGIDSVSPHIVQGVYELCQMRSPDKALLVLTTARAVQSRFRSWTRFVMTKRHQAFLIKTLATLIGVAHRRERFNSWFQFRTLRRRRRNEFLSKKIRTIPQTEGGAETNAIATQTPNQLTKRFH